MVSNKRFGFAFCLEKEKMSLGYQKPGFLILLFNTIQGLFLKKFKALIHNRSIYCTTKTSQFFDNSLYFNGC